MALVVERIVDGGVHAEEALGGCCRFEPLHHFRVIPATINWAPIPGFWRKRALLSGFLPR
jgi:hypothetical protein